MPSNGPPLLLPARPAGKSNKAATTSAPISSAWDGVEVVPDSEEERTRGDPIEILDSEGETALEPRKPQGDHASRVRGGAKDSPSSRKTLQTSGTPTSSRTKTSTSGTPLNTQRRPHSPTPTSSRRKDPGTPVNTPSIRPAAGIPTSSKVRSTGTPVKRPPFSQSTSSDDEDEVVVLHDYDPFSRTHKSKPPPKQSNTPRTPSPVKPTRGIPRVAEDSDSDVEVVDGPSPVPFRSPSPTQPKRREKNKGLYAPNTDSESSTEPDSDSDRDAIFDVDSHYAKFWKPTTTTVPMLQQLEEFKQAIRNSRIKPISEADQVKLDAGAHAARQTIYAEKIYSYFNNKVFKDQLPPLDEIEIIWSNRMTKTAGRAEYHRDRHGNEKATIYLSAKVVDSAERVRNTLCHEMCHLATWIIDKQLREGHGDFFRKWAKKIEKKDLCIIISIEHTYVISYPYEWECTKCDHLVQRWQYSFDHKTTRCPKCKTGRVELSKAPGRDPGLKVIGKMAAAKLPSSSHSRPRQPVVSSFSVIPDNTDEEDDGYEDDIQSIHTQKEIYVVADSDTKPDAEEQIADLAKEFEAITIAHKVCLHAKRSKKGRKI
ncbi:SprT-like family-domain-containing protein [Mycena crocata]|nr:SprT-like family-domain-containing protein [Mycena crocata]